MTRRSDMMLEDIFGCDHKPETPISEDGQVIGWLCRCGRRLTAKAPEPEAAAEGAAGGGDGK